MSIQKVGGKRW